MNNFFLRAKEASHLYADLRQPFKSMYGEGKKSKYVTLFDAHENIIIWGFDFYKSILLYTLFHISSSQIIDIAKFKCISYIYIYIYMTQEGNEYRLKLESKFINHFFIQIYRSSVFCLIIFISIYLSTNFKCPIYLSIYLSIYVYNRPFKVCSNVFTFLVSPPSLSFSLSLSLYIYIYIYILWSGYSFHTSKYTVFPFSFWISKSKRRTIH